jgi:hypothetical protein
MAPEATVWLGSVETTMPKREDTSMAESKKTNEAVALMEVAKLVNELRNAVVLVGLVMGKDLHYDAAVNAASKLREIGVREELIPGG